MENRKIWGAVDGNHHSKSCDVDTGPLKRMGQKNTVGVSRVQSVTVTRVPLWTNTVLLQSVERLDLRDVVGFSF